MKKELSICIGLCLPLLGWADPADNNPPSVIITDQASYQSCLEDYKNKCITDICPTSDDIDCEQNCETQATAEAEKNCSDQSD